MPARLNVLWACASVSGLRAALQYAVTHGVGLVAELLSDSNV